MSRRSKKSNAGAVALPSRLDAGMLLLRLGIGLPMLLQHGVPYLMHFEEEAGRFLPLMGLDSRLTLALAVAAEVGGSILIIVGLWTRAAALAVAGVMAAAFFIVHGASFQGEQSGELAFMYLIACLTLALAGPGRYAWD